MFDLERTQNKNVLCLFLEILVSIRDTEMSMRLSAEDKPSSFFLFPNALLIMALSQKQEEPNGKRQNDPPRRKIFLSGII